MPKFSRGHYIFLADAMNSAFRYFADVQQPNESTRHAANGVEHAAIMLADRLEGDNPRFDREHFLAVVRGEREIESRVPRSKSRIERCRVSNCNDWAVSEGYCSTHAINGEGRGNARNLET